MAFYPPDGAVAGKITQVGIPFTRLKGTRILIRL
jgi:hypothetical protein